MTKRSLRVLGIFPHPDDEAYACGGTLARLSAEGAEVNLLCATSGGAGRDLRTTTNRDDLDNVRAAELACSCSALGINPPRFLGLDDGGIDAVNFPDVVGEIVRSIRRLQPHLVLSLGPDGVYGHPDHIALYRLIIASFASAMGGDRFPAEIFGQVWEPQRLYLAAFPKGMFLPKYEQMLASEYAGAIRAVDRETLGVEPRSVSATVDIRAYADQKLAAITCHRSQLPGGDPYALFPGDLVRRTLTTELFTLGAGKPVRSLLRGLDQDLDL